MVSRGCIQGGDGRGRHVTKDHGGNSLQNVSPGEGFPRNCVSPALTGKVLGPAAHGRNVAGMSRVPKRTVCVALRLTASVLSMKARFSRRGLGAPRGKRMEIWMKFVSLVMNERDASLPLCLGLDGVRSQLLQSSGFHSVWGG